MVSWSWDMSGEAPVSVGGFGKPAAMALQAPSEMRKQQGESSTLSTGAFLSIGDVNDVSAFRYANRATPSLLRLDGFAKPEG